MTMIMITVIVRLTMEEDHAATKTLRAFGKTMEDYVYVAILILLISVSYYFWAFPCFGAG